MLHVSINRLQIALLVAAVCVQTCTAQICRLSVSGLNRNRRVIGPVNTECPVSPISLHSPPFGNWGVTSTFGPKVDGRQFEGWCHNTRACDNNGRCATYCVDGWYEWNSCTDAQQYRAPNATLYNAAMGTQQVTITGINIHGTKSVDILVSCPLDADGDGLAENGGCADVQSYRSGTNFMSLYELDPGTGSDLVQTLYFPELALTTGCRAWNCTSATSNWVEPVGYDTPKSPAIAFAEAAMRLNSGTFIDNNRACRLTPLRSETVSGASFLRGPVSPESIVSIFGEGLATSTAAAARTPLPASLGGSTVAVIDSAGVSRPASLFYASPGQINFLIPAGTPAGTARVITTREDAITSQSIINVAQVAPGIFSADASGKGIAAAILIRVAPDGTQSAMPVFRCEAGTPTCAAVPITLGDPAEQVILSLFGTGIRFHSGVQVTAGGMPVEVLYAGAQGQYVGLDQVNVRLPRSLQGSGSIEMVITAGTARSNPVTVNLQ